MKDEELLKVLLDEEIPMDSSDSGAHLTCSSVDGSTHLDNMIR